jgi:hypothetical protein
MAATSLLDHQQNGLTIRVAAPLTAAPHAPTGSQHFDVVRQGASIIGQHMLLGTAAVPSTRQHYAPSDPLGPSTVFSTWNVSPTGHLMSRAQSPAVQRKEIVSVVAAVRDLLSKEQIAAARKTLDTITVSSAEEPAIRSLRRALAVPVVQRSLRKDQNRTSAYEWLRHHAHQYKGQWVAVGEAGLIATAATLKELRAQLRILAPSQKPLVHKL